MGNEKKVLHIDLEGSAEDLQGFIVDPPPTSLDDMRKLVSMLSEGGAKNYDGVCIDTINILNRWAEDETLQELREERELKNLKEMGDDRIGYGQDWARSRRKVSDIVTGLHLLVPTVFVLGHTKVEKGDFSGVNLALPQGLRVAVQGASQVLAYLFATDSSGATKRYISFSPSENTIGGSRYAELNDQVIELPLRDKEKDGKGWVDWSGIFALFEEGKKDEQPI
jgi:hypothetical protein